MGTKDASVRNWSGMDAAALEELIRGAVAGTSIVVPDRTIQSTTFVVGGKACNAGCQF